MLKVWAPSPPVPTMSTMCVASCMHLGGELAHHLRGGGDLADGLLLHAQAGDDGAVITGDISPPMIRHHEVQHLVVEDFAVLDGALQRFLGVMDMAVSLLCRLSAGLLGEGQQVRSR